jgi:uncharacterized delta-60 repeat protein
MRLPVSTMRITCGLLLLAAINATPALAVSDGSLDTTLDPNLGVDPYIGIPGLFNYEVDLPGGAGTNYRYDYVSGTAVQADGKIVAVGWAWNALAGIDQFACVIARFDVDGSLDGGFGNNGRVVFNFNNSAGENDCYLGAVALQGDGKIVAAGTLDDALHGERGIVFRLDPDGSTDAAFDNGESFHGYVIAGDNTSFSAVAIGNDGTIISAGHGIQSGKTDEDFFRESWSGTNGNAFDYHWYPFDLGGDKDDRAYALVLQSGVHPSGPEINGVHMADGTPARPDVIIPAHQEIYLVGSANRAPYADGLGNHDCAIVALDDATTADLFTLDASFGNGGKLAFDSPIFPSNEGDNICRTAVSRHVSGAAFGGSGIIVGGENYFISTLDGGGTASNYALADIDGSGTVVRQDEVLPFYQAISIPGVFNSIDTMVRAHDGKLVVAGYAGTSSADHQPSDVGVIRFNADFSRDQGFGTGGGVVILSLDGLGPVERPHQVEYATSVALDNRGRIVLVGPRSQNLDVNQDYDWLVSRLNTSDQIFVDSFDGIVPPVQ